MNDNNNQPNRRGGGQQQQADRRPQQQPARRDVREVEAAGKSRYTDHLARVTRELERDTVVLAGLLMAEPGSAILGQFINEVALAINKAYKKDGSNPLLDADPASFRSAIREAAGFGFSLNPRLGECYLIPRKGMVEMQSGYKGLNKLAYRSGIVSSLHATCVYKGEPYKHVGGSERPRIEHEPDDTGTKRTNKWPDILSAYAVAFIGDSKHAIFQVAPKWRLALARGSGTTDAWKDHPDAMCRKTALVMLASELPRHDKLRDFHLAVEHDLMLDVDPPEFTVGIDDMSESAGRGWRDALEGYGSIGIDEAHLLAYLGAESSGQITSEHLVTLENTFRRARDRDPAAIAEIEKMRAGPQPAVEQASSDPEPEPECNVDARAVE